VEYTGSYDTDCIYLCRNKENNNEYIAISDFLNQKAISGSINLLFSEEEWADTIVNTTVITRDSHNPGLDNILNDIIDNRAFAITDSKEYSIFDILSATNNTIINLKSK
jgi:Na+-translocating ferredoxin:NAD+ oxidoreductase RnfG subunit